MHNASNVLLLYFSFIDLYLFASSRPRHCNLVLITFGSDHVRFWFTCAGLIISRVIMSEWIEKYHLFRHINIQLSKEIRSRLQNPKGCLKVVKLFSYQFWKLSLRSIFSEFLESVSTDVVLLLFYRFWIIRNNNKDFWIIRNNNESKTCWTLHNYQKIPINNN